MRAQARRILAPKLFNVMQETRQKTGVHFFNGEWNPIKEFSSDYEERSISPGSGNCELKVYGGIDVKILLYGVIGPYGTSDVYVEMIADTSADPWWSLYGGVQAGAGVEVNIFGFFTIWRYDVPDIIDASVLIAEAEPKIFVPGVIGMEYGDAVQSILDADLSVGDENWVHSDEFPENTVIIQNPLPGFRIIAGSPVDLTLSLGPDDETVTVPDAVGMSRNAAEDTITGAGLAVGTITEQYSDTVPEGHVISQNPAAGAEVEAGSAVDLVVSGGPEPAENITVPDVVGESQSTAESMITNTGLEVGMVTEEYSNTVSDGYVISQYPAAGESVLVGSSIDIVVSKGPDNGGGQDHIEITFEGVIYEQGDKDWFQFEAKAGWGYIIRQTGELWERLDLYEPDGETSIKYDEAHGIDWHCEVSGTYYLRVRGYSTGRTGSYVIEIAGQEDDFKDDQ